MMLAAAASPSPWMILPFAVLLGVIALAPLLFAHWWEQHYPKVAFGLAAVTLGYYLFGLGATPQVLHTAHEYVSFIALIGSLYIVSGGIHIRISIRISIRIRIRRPPTPKAFRAREWEASGGATRPSSASWTS